MVKSRLRHGIYYKFSKGISEKELFNEIKRRINSEKLKLLNKGKRILLYEVNVGLDQDDYIMELQTIIAKFYIFKIPRIISKRLIQ